MIDNDIPLLIYDSKISTQKEINTLKKNLETNPKNNAFKKSNIEIYKKNNIKTSPSKNNKNLRSSTPEIKKYKLNYKKSHLKFSNSQNNFFNPDLSKEINIDNKLRNEFQLLLGKLNNSSTKEISFTQIKDLIKKNHSQKDLRVYISCLSTNHENCTIGAKEIYVLIYGLLSNIYQENLMDPLDNPPNIIKTINRILNHIFKFYLIENSYIIHKACALSICDLFDNCMPKDNLKIIKMIFIENLINLISIGTNKNIQNGASICLSDFIFHIGKNLNNNLIYHNLLFSLDEKIINLCCKHSQDNPFIFEALYNLIFFTDIEVYNNNFKEIYDKIYSILSESNKDKYSLNTKINCLNILNIIAIKAEKIADMSIGYFQEEIMFIIQLNTKDKNLKIQKVAKETLKNWIKLKEINEKYDNKKRVLNQDLNLDLDKKKYTNNNLPAKKMDKLNFLRNLAKMSKNENNNNYYNYDKELTFQMKNKVYDNGMNNVIQLSNLIQNKKEKNFSKTMNIQKEINDYLKNSNQVKKYNAYNLNYPLKSERNNKLNNEEQKKNFKENSIKNFNYEDEENEDKMNIYNNNNNSFLEDEKEELMNPIQQNEIKLNNIINKFENNQEINIERNLMNKNRKYTKSNNENNIKLQLQNLFNNTLLKSFIEFEKNINSKLYDMNTRINDISDKIKQYKENPNNNNDNILNSLDSTKYYINNQQFKVENSIKTKSISSNKKEDKIEKEYLNDKIKELFTNNETDCQIIKDWKEVLLLIDNNSPNEAYTKILNTGDDIYLLRLVCITGPIFNKLNSEISKRILMRINMISRSHQIQSLLINLIRSSLKYNVFNLLNQQEKNDVLDSLYEFSGINSIIGADAAELYTQITKNKILI